MAIPGVGPLLASALVASVPDPHAFKSGRNLAAWVGLVPKQNSSGGKERLGGITKQGDRYLRQLLVVGALAVVRYAERHGTRRPWLVQLLARRPTKVATVALANKTARIAWAIMTSGETLPRAGARPLEIRRFGADELGKGRQDVMHPAGRYRKRENPLAPERLERVLLVGTRPRGRHHGQRPRCAALNRSNTWPHRPAQAEHPKHPCHRRAVHT